MIFSILSRRIADQDETALAVGALEAIVAR
jgi:hypothetical protein